MRSKVPIIVRFHRWRLRNLSERKFVVILSVLIGIIAGMGATIIKNAVRVTQRMISHLIDQGVHNYIYVVLPFVGIFLTVLFVKYIVRKPVRHGIPNVLHSISRRKGELSRHNLYSSIVTSALTVGFGGSVGLEGPTVATGAAYGSWISKFFRLDYRHTILLLSCASAAGMAAIFKAPIAAIVFALEVIMLDLTTFSMVPLLMATSSAVVTSYFFLGQEVLYPFDVKQSFVISELPFYVFLGIIAGLVSAYFTKVYIFIAGLFEKVKNVWRRLFTGGIILGVLIFILPSLYGEGYDGINACLKGNMNYLFDNSMFFKFKEDVVLLFILMIAVTLLKVVATSITFGSGGVGGVFAPTLFTGANTGMFFAMSVEKLGFTYLDKENFALIGMSGLIAGVLQAPLTGVFLIADISGGYELFVPLIITAIFSYLTVKIFSPSSVYHFQLAQREELMTHDQDKNVLRMMEVSKLLETDFITLHPDASLRDLTDAISRSHRNLFPIVDENGYMKGMLKMDDIRHLIFKQELYDKVRVGDLMYHPEYYISTKDSMKDVVEKFESSGRYNIAVIDDGKYVGFISRARVFSFYRKTMSMFSHD